MHRLHFTAEPSPELALVFGDVIQNLRAALDHLRAALVPYNRRSAGYFPSFWQGVGEDDADGDDKQTTSDRANWRTFTAGMHPDAVAFIQTLQPERSRLEAENLHGLPALNRLAVRDRHREPVELFNGLTGTTTVVVVMPDGSVDSSPGTPTNHLGFMQDEAELAGVPTDAVNVQIAGTPEVFVRAGTTRGGFPAVRLVQELWLPGMRWVLDSLRPYVVT